MGQGAVVDLANHSLVTNELRSCSALLFINRERKRAGLYHYPAGPLKYKRVRLIADMIDDVGEPDHIALRLGGGNARLREVGLPGFSGEDGVPDLRRVLGYVCPQIDEKMVLTGSVWVGLADGVPQILDRWPSGAVTSLEKTLAGNYSGVNVYGKA